MRKIFGILSVIFVIGVLMPMSSFAAEKSSGIIIPLSGITQDVRQVKTLVGDYVVISPNKKILGIWNRNAKTLTLYDAAGWQPLKTFQGNYAAFSSDGKTLAIENDDKTVALYDTATWKQIQGFAEKSASFSPEKSSIKTPDTVTLYDTNTWQAIKTLDVTLGDYFNAFLYGDGKLLRVSESGPSKETLYDTATGQEIKTIEEGAWSSYSNRQTFHGNTKFLTVWVSESNKLTLYDASTWQAIKTFDGTDADFNEDGNVLIVKDIKAKKLTLYDITTGKATTSFLGHVYFDENNKVLKVIDFEAKKLTLYDLTARQAITADGSQVEFTEDGKLFKVSDNKTNKVTIYDRATWQVIKTFDGDYANFDKAGKLLSVVAKEANKVTLYDTSAWQVIKTIEGSSASFDKAGKLLAVGDDKANKVTLYDTSTWQAIKTFDGEYAYFDKDDKLLLVRDSKITLYDRATWRMIKTFDGDGTIFDAAGKLLYVPDKKTNKVTLYDATTWDEIKTFEGEYISFDAASKLLNVPDKKTNKVTLYDITTRQEMTFDGSYVAFPKNGNMLVIHDFKADKKTFFDATKWQVMKIDDKYRTFRKDDKLLQVDSYEPRKTTIYDTATGQVVKTFDGGVDYFVQADKFLTVKDSSNHKTTIYDTTTWQVVKTFDTDKHLSFSGDMVSVPNPGKQLDFYAYNPDGIDLKSFFAKGEFETTKEYERRLNGLELPYEFNVKLGGYDADRDGFEGEVKGTKVFVPVPRDKAKEFISRKDKAFIEGRLKYYDSQNLQLIDAKLIDETTNDKYAVLKTSEGTTVAYVPPKPAPIYAPKPTAQEIPAENIHDIPDFKSSPRNNDLAVIIGIENYRGLPKSDYSKSDAGIMKDYLRALGFQERNVTLLTDDNASLSDIKKTLETWLHNKAKKESKVFIYYSGHGAPEPKTGDAYIVPFDGDPNYLEDTGYSLRRLYEKLGKLQVAEVAVVLDSCFSGAGGRSVLAKGARPLVMMTDIKAIPSNIAVLSATQGTQISTSSPEKGHGIFTYYFLKALKDGKKNIAEIYEYIKPLVEDDAKQINVQQSPSISPDVGKLRGRFGLRK